jgi:hypothetical protein
MLIKKSWLAAANSMRICEAALLEDGSQQQAIWGAAWYPLDHEVGFESLINIRPRQHNRTLAVQDPDLRKRIEHIVRRLLEVR